MSISKLTGQDCTVSISSIDYMGPQLSAYIFAEIIQGSVSDLASLKYISPVQQIVFAPAIAWVTTPVNINLVMKHTGQPIAAGDVSCTIVICDSANLSVAKSLYTQIFSGVYSFTFPSSSWRNMTTTFAAQVSRIDASFGA